MTDRGDLLRVLDEVRQTGIAYNREEATPGICSAAIAIAAAPGRCWRSRCRCPCSGTGAWKTRSPGCCSRCGRRRSPSSTRPPPSGDPRPDPPLSRIRGNSSRIVKSWSGCRPNSWPQAAAGRGHGGTRVRLCMFRLPGGPREGWPGRVEGDQIIRLGAPDVTAVLARGGRCRRRPGPRPQRPAARPGAPAPVGAGFLRLRAAHRHRPGQPRRERPGRVVRVPGFLLHQPGRDHRSRADVPYPAGTAMLDYELEVAAVIGAGGRSAGSPS